MEIKEERLLTMTVEQAGEALGISRATAYMLARTGNIPAVRLGRRLLISRAGLERLLAEAGKPKEEGIR